MKKYDLGVINSEIEQMILRAQEELEKAIVAYGIAVDAYADAEMEYKKAKASFIIKLKNGKESVTLIPHLAEGESAELKKECISAEGNVKRLKMLVDAITERINGIKFIGRRVEENLVK